MCWSRVPPLKFNRVTDVALLIGYRGDHVLRNKFEDVHVVWMLRTFIHWRFGLSVLLVVYLYVEEGIIM